jgi:hypothetical protein
MRLESIRETEDLTISALAEAKATLKHATTDAVDLLIRALDASNRYGPKWDERIKAAIAILDRADPDTAGAAAPALQRIDKAIMHIYGTSSIDAPAPATIVDNSNPTSHTADSHANAHPIHDAATHESTNDQAPLPSAADERTEHTLQALLALLPPVTNEEAPSS